MSKRSKRSKGDVEWWITTNKKRKTPTHHSTKAASDTIKVLLDTFGSMQAIHEAIQAKQIICSTEEKDIVAKFVELGINNPKLM